MYRKRECVKSSMKHSFSFLFSLYNSAHDDCFMSSQSNRYIQYILSIYIFPTRHMYSRGPTRLTSYTPHAILANLLEQHPKNP